MLQKLDRSKYVSLSRERRLDTNGSDNMAVANSTNEGHGARPSLFSIGMPGALSLGDVLRNVSLIDIPIGLKEDGSQVNIIYSLQSISGSLTLFD